MERFKSGARVFAVLTASTLAAYAQTSNGVLVGTVSDPSGAVVNGATVTVKSVQTGETRTAQTNNVGGYRIEALQPGDYNVTIKAPSFSDAQVANVHVNASTLTSVNAQMKVGAAEVVDVEASGDLIKTDTGELSSTIPTTEVQNLPVQSLNAYSLATTLPGVTTVAGADFTNGTSYSVNGMRPRSNNFLIEGQDNNDAGIHGQGLQPANLDAIKEVTVLTNSFPAEFGHGGSVSNLIFQSGTNQFHGAAWDLLQNSALNANDKNNVLNGVPKASSRENTYGFSLGGPIKRDKAFFFTSYQWDAFRSSTNGDTLTVPTAAGFATLQSLDPNGTNPRIQNYLTALGNVRGATNTQAIPLGNGRPDVEVGDVKRTGLPNDTDAPEFDVKGDVLLRQSDTLSVRYIRNSFTAPLDAFNFPAQLPGFDTQQSGSAHNAGINETHIFSPSLVNELRVSYGRIGFSFLPQAATTANPLGVGPTISINGLEGFGAPSGVPQGRFHNTYQYQDALSWTKGSHTLKFGADIADTRVRDAIPFNNFGSISYLAGGGFSALANYIDDFGGKGGSVAETFGNPIVRPRLVSQAYYFQDSWKMRPNFTLDYGLRYEYDGTPANVLPFPAIDPSNPFDPNYPARVAEQGDKNNFGPRVGFAFTPRTMEKLFGENKTVIRGGFGIFYDSIFTNILDNNASGSPNAVGATVASSTGRGLANLSQLFTTLSPVASPLASETSIANNLVNPESLQWNLTVQRELPASFVFTTSYVGTRGEHLYAQNYLNPFDPNTGDRVNPNRGPIIIRDNSGDSIYHGLDATLERRMSKGLLFRAAYTYSKYIDDASEIFTSLNLSAYPSVQAPFVANRGLVDRGLSAFDRRNRLDLVYVYSPAKWNVSNGFLKPVAMLANNWQISGVTTFQSGAPVNVEDGFDANGDGISNDRPALGNPAAPLATYGIDSSQLGLPGGTLCNGPIGVNEGTCTPVNGSDVHFIIPANGVGNIQRNSTIVPQMFQNWNFTLQRTFPIKERVNLEFRAELFNAFNHGNYDPTLLNSTLLSGIPESGTNTFLNYPLTVDGNRTMRFWLHFRF